MLKFILKDFKTSILIKIEKRGNEMSKLSNLLKPPHIKEIFSYLVFGVLTTCVNLMTLMILNFLGINYMLNTVIAWFLSVLFAFYTNRTYVFKKEELSNLKSDFIKFFLSRITSMFLDLLLMYVLVDMINTPLIAGKLIDNIFIIILNYFLSKFLIFKK